MEIVYGSRNVKFRKGFRDVMKDSAVSLRPWKLTTSNEYLAFLGEFKAICETALAHESGP
jgi:hypothetical protein